MTKITLEMVLMLSVLAVLVAVVGVSGCTSSSNYGSVDASVKYLQTTDTLINSGYIIPATPGHVFLVYSATVKNVNSTNRNVDEYAFKLRDTAGHIYDVDTSSTGADGAMRQVSSSQPGDIVSGNIAYRVPVGTVPTTITYDDGYQTVTMPA
jgi:hypothetical protein